jgi:hypothetical protein
MTFDRKEFYRNLMRSGAGPAVGGGGASPIPSSAVRDGSGAKLGTSPLTFWTDYFMGLPASGPFGKGIIRPPLSLWR